MTARSIGMRTVESVPNLNSFNNSKDCSRVGSGAAGAWGGPWRGVWGWSRSGV